MLETVRQTLDYLLGLSLEAKDLGAGHMLVRCTVVFVFGVVLVRLADRRLLGHNAGFDIVVVVILGSVLSRGINGQASFFPSLFVSGWLVILHHVLARAAFHSAWFSTLIKGRDTILVRNGKLDYEQLRSCNITKDDLAENLRVNANKGEPADVAEARLERNGIISVIKKGSHE